ncbi:MAG: single-stranded-DNA-specific exonuclease RecJ [Bacteroidota bacterium]|uniref:Single-stranded-DNA-specific exonuclease RecJ n=1 Tax=Parabacteroides chartae TaxID=1037355 RepID=A0A1T5BNV1_9BACT|nr:single-stranded-DNA-specific exonuclease RecJ [Parabacteroides chartae]MDT3369237.1 single-stranded-DNA-specific exonuclease RecJ [Bacteroidota bacterium]SKB48896.1 single-stranded-DNA-specific exonuclease [Parabacteroides chartae]HML70580.1 single-stranded-DNA-specific exonuclease RecJ [Macellibacteroides fermentans]
MTNKWNFQKPTEEENRISKELADKLAISPVICQLLVKRGITTEEEANKFFKPSLNDLHDPFLMPDMDKAVKRLNKALGEREKILVYGDYDVDGTTAVSLVYKFLRPYTTLLDYYIPDRYDEGYGISYKGIDYAANNDVKLIISLDCGIKAIEKIEYAKQKGIDFIICDHHMPDDTLPDAVAVLDAKRVDSIYPYEHLSGCGVGFKLMQAFAKSNNFPFADLEKLLDLCAVSIASDIVPITGENRIMAYYGLKQINSNPSLGLKGIIDVCGLTGKEITMSDIVFKIGPRINASGRMMNGKEAVDLLLAKDSESAREKSENINQYNDERRELDKKITDEANAIIDDFQDMADRKAIVVFNPAWHKGVIGIVASRLTEKYYRPAVVLTKSSELITGSARSVSGFDIYKAIESCRDLLENFGGHTYAAGLSLKEENLEAFTNRFLQLAADEIVPEQMVPQLDVDAILDFKDINAKFMHDLKKMSPFGPDNQKPVFCSRRVKDYGTSKLVGKDLEHIKLELIDANSNSPIHGIAFGMHKHSKHIKGMKPFNICYTVEENTYNGNTSLQLMIKDIKPDDI